MVFDEIYIYQTVEYCSAKFVGLSEDGISPATSVLCFMINSLVSKYCNVVLMVPLNGINVEKLDRYFHRAMQLVSDAGFVGIATIADNPVNRNFFAHRLSNGQLHPEVPHPTDSSKRFFLLIDIQ